MPRCSSGNSDSRNGEGAGTRCQDVVAVILIVVIVGRGTEV